MYQIVKGEDLTLRLYVFDSSGSPVDFTGNTGIAIQIPNASGGLITKSEPAEITVISNGVLDVAFYDSEDLAEAYDIPLFVVVDFGLDRDIYPLSDRLDVILPENGLPGGGGGGGGGGGDLPNGGTTNQVLRKASNIDLDVEWHTLVSSDVGLGNANNTSDVNKPVSTAQALADGAVQSYSIQRANHTGTQASTTISDFATAAKAAAVQDAMVDGVLDVAPSQNAVFDAIQPLIIGGSNDRMVHKDNLGVVKSLEEVQVGLTTGFEQLDLVRTLSNQAGNFDVNRFNLNFSASANSPNETWCARQVQLNVDFASTGFQFGTAGTAFRFLSHNVSHLGTGDLGTVEFIQNNFNIGNGTDPIDFKGFGYAFGFGVVNANVQVVGSFQGYGFQPNVNASASFAALNTYINAFYDFANILCESPSYNSFTASPTLASVRNNNNYSGLSINPTITTFNGNASGYGVAVGGNWGAFNSGGIYGISINQTATNAAYAYGIYVSMDNVTVYPGAVSSLVAQDLTIDFQAVGDNDAYQVEYVNDVLAGSETAGLAGQLVTVHMESGVSTATQIKAAIEANVSLNSNLTVTVSGVGGNAQTAFAAVNFAGGEWAGQKRAGYFDGDVEVTGGLTFGGALSIGQLNAFSSQPLVDGGGTPSSIHSLITNPTVAANAVLTSGDTISVNTAALINIGDNATVGTSFIGVAALGLPAVLTMGIGSTIDRVYGALFALSLDAGAGGGTADEVGLCKSLAIPNGVTTVNKLYGYLFDLPFGDPGTTTWGFYDRPGKNNYFAGNLLIGGTAGTDDTVTNASVALEVKSTTKAFVNARMTTAERNALTAINGMQLYNTTTDKLQVYAAGSWVDLH